MVRNLPPNQFKYHKYHKRKKIISTVEYQKTSLQEICAEKKPKNYLRKHEKKDRNEQIHLTAFNHYNEVTAKVI